MAVGLQAAVKRLEKIVESTRPGCRMDHPFQLAARGLDESRKPLRDRDFAIIAEPPRSAGLTGRLFKSRLSLLVRYRRAEPATRLMAGSDLAILQTALADPANHGGPNVSGILAVSEPVAVNAREFEGGLVAIIEIELTFQEAAAMTTGR